jgi:hypothetical protein
MVEMDAKTKKANRRLLALITIFAVLFCGLVIFWKALS